MLSSSCARPTAAPTPHPFYPSPHAARAVAIAPQLEGINWLLACWHARRSTILADEMGLGKTCQLLLTLQWLVEHRKLHGPFLIVAPVSTLGHWQREVLRWTRLSCVVLHGPADARRSLLNTEGRHSDVHGRATGRRRYHVLITAPDSFTAELSALSALPWQYLIVDEAHRLKNPHTKLYRALTSLRTRHCTLLTGSTRTEDGPPPPTVPPRRLHSLAIAVPPAPTSSAPLPRPSRSLH